MEASEQNNQNVANNAIAEYEKKHGLKDGKPIEGKGKKGKKNKTVVDDDDDDDDDVDDDLDDLPPAFKKMLQAQQKQIQTLTDNISTLTKPFPIPAKTRLLRHCLIQPSCRKNGLSVLM